MGFRLAMFDFNGTLLDDLEIAHESTMEVFIKFGIPGPSFKDYRNSHVISADWYYDRGVSREIDRLEIRAVFSSAMLSRVHRSKLHKGARKLLTGCRKHGMKLALISALPAELLHTRVGQVKIGKEFHEIRGGAFDKAATFREMFKKFGIAPTESFYVGDTASDLQFSKQAGLTSIAFLGGYNTPEALLAEKPDFMVKSLLEVLQIAEAR